MVRAPAGGTPALGLIAARMGGIELAARARRLAQDAIREVYAQSK